MKKYIVVSLLLATIAFASCGPTQVVVRERPVIPVYVRPLQPRSSYLWIDGNYIRSGSGYSYRNGYWAAQRRNRVYHQGYWKQTRRGYVWVNGGW